MVEGLREEMSAAFVSNKFLRDSSKFQFHERTKSFVNAQNLQSIKTFLTLELS